MTRDSDREGLSRLLADVLSGPEPDDTSAPLAADAELGGTAATLGGSSTGPDESESAWLEERIRADRDSGAARFLEELSRERRRGWAPWRWFRRS